MKAPRPRKTEAQCERTVQRVVPQVLVVRERLLRSVQAIERIHDEHISLGTELDASIRRREGRADRGATRRLVRREQA